MADQNKVVLPDNLEEIVVDFGDICRFCLTETKNGISINEKCFPEESKDLKSDSAYDFITKLRIIEEQSIQNFPTRMCESCFELIKLFYNFSQVCQRSDTLLRECYQNTLNETKSRLNVRDEQNEISEVGGSNFFSVRLPEIVHSVEKNKQKLSALSGEIKKAQSKLTESFHITSSTGSQAPSLKNKTPHPCPQCSMQFSNPGALNFHYAATHTHDKCRTVFKFECRNCRKTFSQLERLKRHYRIIHRTSESELTEAFLSNKVKHSIQSDKVSFYCFQCVPYKQFQSQKQLVSHLEESHEAKPAKDSLTLFSCAHCSLSTFPNRLSLSQHLLTVHKLKEDEITWNDVKVVSHSGAKSPEVEIKLSEQKTKIISTTDSLLGQQGLTSCWEREQEQDFNSRLPSERGGDNPLESWTESSTDAKDDSGWNCPECPASYSRKQSLHCHMREKHNHSSPGATKCPECSETFLTNRRLIRHGISAHQKYFAYFHQVFKKVLQPAGEGEGEGARERNFECDVCRRKYIYKTSLRKHILAAHLGRSGQDAVACSYCGKTLSSKLNLRSHIEFVHEALFVCCPICKKRINLRTIGRHYKTHRTDAEGVFPGNFLCNLCGRVLKSRRSFEDHQKLHQNIRDEVCDVCGSGFTTKKLLRLHKKTHEGAARKLFACGQCEKVFSGRHTLNRHLLTHSGQKNFICEICSKCFYTIQELNRHVRYHRKDYKFDCQLCDMRFLCKSRFRHHMMKHRNVRPHKCQFCDKMFIERAKMNLHMAAKHNVEVHNRKTVWKDPQTYVPLDDLL